MNIREIAQACQRLDGLLFGAEDLVADLGASRSPAGWEIFYGRSAVVTAAAAYGLEAIDTVFVNFADQPSLEADAMFAKNLGFTGKLAIHPGQVGIVNRVFSPTASEIAWAKKIVQAYYEHGQAGSGVFALEDRMIDLAHVRAARRLLDKARVASLT
jgi:citrate lyase subunit beta-like protein